MDEKNTVAAHVAAGVCARPSLDEGCHAEGRYRAEARSPDGTLLWVEEFDNLVTTQGKNAMLDTFIGRQTAYANCYMGLISSATAPVAGDTYASRGFTEAGTAIVAARLAPTFGAASAGSKAASAVTFTILSSATIYGAILVFGAAGTSAAGDTATASAVLYSAGTFSSSRALQANDTISVTYSTSV